MDLTIASLYVTDNRLDHRGQSDECAYIILWLAAPELYPKHASSLIAINSESPGTSADALVCASLANLRIHLLILSVK